MSQKFNKSANLENGMSPDLKYVDFFRQPGIQGKERKNRHSSTYDERNKMKTVSFQVHSSMYFSIEKERYLFKSKAPEKVFFVFF